MSLSFFETWQQAEHNAAELFYLLIPMSQHYDGLLESYQSFQDIALTILAPLYAPIAFIALSLFSTLIAITTLLLALTAYLVAGFAYLFNYETLNKDALEFADTNLAYPLVNLYQIPHFLLLAVISGPYALLNAVTRTISTLLNLNSSATEPVNSLAENKS